MTKKAIFNLPKTLVFKSGLEEYENHSGQEVEVLESGENDNGLIIFTVRASDGWEAVVYEDELTFIEE